MSYSANDNQNFFVQSGRTTSRVLNRPGGNCSLTLGGWTEEELEQQRLKREGKSKAVPDSCKANEPAEKEDGPSAFPTASRSDVSPDATAEPTVKTDAASSSATANAATDNGSAPASQLSSMNSGTSSNAFASSSTTNSFNVVTDRPTSRVTRPPGGHTSIRLG